MSHSLDSGTSFPALTIGLDLGDRQSQLCAVDAGGQRLEERAVIAVARKLAVLLHHLWQHDVAYDPEHLARRRAA